MKEESDRKKEDGKKIVLKLFLAYLFQFFYPYRNLDRKIISQAT